MFAWNKIEFSNLNGNLVVLTIRPLTLHSEVVAFGDADRHPAWPARNEFIHEGISSIHRAYADRIRASPGGLASLVRNGNPRRRARDARQPLPTQGPTLQELPHEIRPGERQDALPSILLCAVL